MRAVKPPTQPSKRRWGRFGAGAAAAAIGAWLFAAMYLSAGDRTEVLVRRLEGGPVRCDRREPT